MNGLTIHEIKLIKIAMRTPETNNMIGRLILFNIKNERSIKLK